MAARMLLQGSVERRDRARRDEGVAVKSRCAANRHACSRPLPTHHSSTAARFPAQCCLTFLTCSTRRGARAGRTLAEKFTPDRRSETRCRLLCWACTDVCIAREERSHLISKCAQPSLRLPTAACLAFEYVPCSRRKQCIQCAHTTSSIAMR